MTQSGVTSRQLIVILGLVIVGVLAAGGWFYRAQEQHLRRNAESYLGVIAQLKVDEITRWRSERLGDAAVLVGDSFFAHTVARWMANPQAGNADNILTRFRSLRTYYGYSDVRLVDAEGKALLSLSSHRVRRTLRVRVDGEEMQVVKDACRERRALLSDLHSGVETSAPHVAAVAPLFAGVGGRPVGAVVLISNAEDFLYPLVQSWPTLSRSAETLLVRKDGDSVLFLNDLRHRKNTALKLHIPLTRKDVPAVMAVLGRKGVVEGTDYRGVKVLSVLRRVPESPWFIVAKMDVSESLAVWRVRSVTIVLVLVLLILAAVTVAAAVWQQNAKAHYKALLYAETARRKAEERHRITLMSLGDGVITTDTEGRVELLNPVAETLTGWSQNDARGQPLEEVFHIVNEGTRQPVESPVRRVLREGLIVGLAKHTVLLARDGAEIPIADSGAPIRDGQGEITGVVLVFRDQAAERAAQQALVDSETRYRRLFESAQDGILILDTKTGMIVDANPFLIEMLSFSHEQFLGKKVWELGSFGDLIANQEKFLELQRQGYVRYENLALETADGRRIDVEFVSNVYSVDHTPVIQCNIRDITDRKRAEAALRVKDDALRSMTEQLWQAAKLASVGELAASIAHELNNPLTTVTLRLESLLDDLPPDTPDRESLAVIDRQVSRMGNLVANLLQFSRRSGTRISSVNLPQEVDKTMELLQGHLRRGSIEVVRDFAEELPFIPADREQLRQVFLNLFTNACDAMPEGGTLTVRASVEAGESASDPGIRASHLALQIEVSDTGEGIPPEILPDVMEPFLTTKPEGKGTGLGLAICHRIVEEHGGAIQLESEQGRGTTVRIVLPVGNGGNGEALGEDGARE